LIVGQVALVLVLLFGAGLMTRSVANLLHINPSLDPRNVVRVYPWLLDLRRRAFNPDPALNKASEAAFAFLEDAGQRIAAIPGVVGVGVGIEGRPQEVSVAPGSPTTRIMRYWIGTGPADPLRTLRVQLKRGRWLDRSDTESDLRPVVINETAARVLWPGGDAVGKRLLAQEGPGRVFYEIAGVVGDTLDYSNRVEPQPTLYRALSKDPGIDTAPIFLVVRTAGHPGALHRPIGQALKAAGGDLHEPEFYNIHDALWTQMAGHRTLLLCLSLFGGAGLLLATIGLYGVVAYSVARRTREIGVRMALGARVEDVMRMVIGQGTKLVAVGAASGFALALAVGRFLRAYLFGVNAADPITFMAVAVLLGVVALLACWMPARHATRVDPMKALRNE
jgi:predicted permease